MNYRTFFLYNVLGATLWSVSLCTVGYYLGQIAFVRNNIEGIVIAIVLVSGIPLIIEGIRMRRRARQSRTVTTPTTSETELPRP